MRTWPKNAWTPVRRGAIYCAPACGGKCTYRAYEKAKADGGKVRAMMQNPHGWNVRIHENLGWHVSLEKNGLTLHWGENGYFIIWNETPYRGKHFKNPNRAVGHWRAAMRAYVTRCVQILVEVQP